MVRLLTFLPSCLRLSPFVVLIAAFLTAGAILAAEPSAGSRKNGQQQAFSLAPVPDGTPEELLEYIRANRPNVARPSSRDQMQQLATAIVEAADKALAQLQAADKDFEEVATAKLEGLAMLGRLGVDNADATLKQFAATLLDGPSAPLAMEAKRLLLVAEAQAMFKQRDLSGAAGLITKTEDLLTADPNDQASAGLAMQLASAFEHMPGGESAAKRAYETFGPIFATSSNESIRQMADSFAGTLRRLSLPGNPMEITGTLLDGNAFDQSTLAGKVVLIDFWATWCGPCVAEIPNVLEQYKKYHARGFEVVGISLDQDRSALEKFVSDRKIPWPILFEPAEGSGWQHPLATYYGISGIPTVILIGRDGNVISLNARGERLGELLAPLFN
jgi:thiol-disulfide isomerase/thioredoxin